MVWFRSRIFTGVKNKVKRKRLFIVVLCFLLVSPLEVQQDDEQAYALLFDRLLSKYNKTYLGDK